MFNKLLNSVSPLIYFFLILGVTTSSLFSKENNKSIYINRFEASGNISNSERQMIENSLMNNILDLIASNKLDLVVFDYSNLEESIFRSVYNTKLGKDFDASKLQLEYKYLIQGNLRKSSEKYTLLIQLSDGGDISRKLKSTKIEFYDYQINYFMDEVSKYLLISRYRINEGNKPNPPELSTTLQKVKIPYSESKMNISKTSLNQRDSLFIEELQKALLLGDEEFKNQNYFEAYQYYKKINSWAASKDYKPKDRRILSSIKSVSTKKIEESLYNFYLTKFNKIINDAVKYSSTSNIEKLKTVYTDLSELRIEITKSELSNKSIIKQISIFSDSITENIIFSTENKATNYYNELKFRKSIIEYEVAKNGFVFFNTRKENIKKKRINSKINIVERSMKERHRNLVLSKLLTSYDLANRYEVKKGIADIQEVSISWSTRGIKTDSLRLLNEAEKEIIKNYDIEEISLVNQYNKYQNQICKSLNEDCSPLKMNKERKIEYVQNLRAMNFLLPGSYNIMYGDKYERKESQNGKLFTSALFYLTLFLAYDNYNSYQKTRKEYNNLNDLAIVNFGINSSNFQNSLPGIIIIGSSSNRLKERANSQGEMTSVFFLMTTLFYFLSNSWEEQPMVSNSKVFLKLQHNNRIVSESIFFGFPEAYSSISLEVKY